MEYEITRKNVKTILDNDRADILIVDLGILPLNCPIDGYQITAIQRIKRHIGEKYWTVKV